VPKSSTSTNVGIRPGAVPPAQNLEVVQTKRLVPMLPSVSWNTQPSAVLVEDKYEESL